VGITRRDMLALLGTTATHASCSTSHGQVTEAPPRTTADSALRRPDPYADAVLVTGEPPLPETDAFTFVVLPDTQNYAEKYPDLFTAQTQWIATHKERRRIAGVFHLGDITNRNTTPEWENARRSLAVLDEADVPCCLIPGNHDYSEGGRGIDRTTRLNDFFPVAAASGKPHWGGTYDREPERMENNFHRIEAAGRRFLILGLEFGPRDDVIRWANDVVSGHPDHEAILLTHVYMFHDDTRYDWARQGTKQPWNPRSYGMAKLADGGVNDGEELWEKLVGRHRTFILTLNGHVLGDGLGRMVSKDRGGRSIPQVLVNFQMRPQGGDGWLRLLEMRRSGVIQTYDYSPTRGQRNESPQNQFLLEPPHA
jgi:3',5'-cyclic AMP phosphodiesterase CpdA